MSKSKTVVGKYIFLDIVNYSHNRPVEAQSDIIHVMNKLVRESISSFKIDNKGRVLIPTGDGMCIALLDMHDPFDIHMQLSLKIMELLYKYNNSQKDVMRQFKIRIGINENTDNLITDINGNKNVAGAGITEAQRIMDQGDGGNIFVGRAVHNHLHQREKYMKKFKAFPVTIKHKEKLDVYQYVDQALEFINSEAPGHLKIRDTIKTTTEQFKKKMLSSVKELSLRIKR